MKVFLCFLMISDVPIVLKYYSDKDQDNTVSTIVQEKQVLMDPLVTGRF